MSESELGGQSVRVARSHEALLALLQRIESGRAPKPDWIHLQAACRLERLSPADRSQALQRLHRCVLRGFRTGSAELAPGPERLDLWRCVAQHGFHDFSDDGWTKNYDSPFVTNYDYVSAYLEGGLDAVDAYAAYSSVLGSHDFGAEELLRSELCADVRTIVEPMAGCGDFAYAGHFRFPEHRYFLFDLDGRARDHVLRLPWLPETEHHYALSNALEEDVWKQVKSFSSGRALGFIGKQSHHLFDARQLLQLLRLGSQYLDVFVLETPAVVLASELPDVDDLTRPEMADAGFGIALVDEPGGSPNPFTNELHFRLELRDAGATRTLFRYPNWTIWQQPVLVALAQLLDLEVSYLHSEHDEFVPIAHNPKETDCHENATLLAFSRRHASS